MLSCVSLQLSSTTVTLSIDILWIDANTVRRFRKTPALVGLSTLQTVRFPLGVTVDLANAKYFPLNVIDGSIIDRPDP